MAEPPTPQRPPVAPNPQYTRQTEPPTPTATNLQRKKVRINSILAPPKMPTEKNAAGDEPSLQGLVTNHFAGIERNARIQKEVFTGLATTLDGFIRSFDKANQSSQRKFAQELADEVGQYLSTVVFARTDSAMSAYQRPQSTHPASSEAPTGGAQLAEITNKPTSAPSETPTYAAAARKPATQNASNPRTKPNRTASSFTSSKARSTPTNTEDPRILVRVLEGRLLHRLTPFAARVALIKELKLQAAELLDVQQTKTGWSIKTAGPEVRNKLISADSQAIISRALEAKKIELPETWVTYIISDVPTTFPNYITRETNDITL
ncbi:hypothetical protein F4823DRAFT_9234 [Ustulina deusta]|nr:hypothetical protein F4823DRAFT_9234 [Ustulina deusta]